LVCTRDVEDGAAAKFDELAEAEVEFDDDVHDIEVDERELDEEELNEEELDEEELDEEELDEEELKDDVELTVKDFKFALRGSVKELDEDS